MKYQVGDDIIVLLSKEEGKVVEIINDKMVMIEVRGVKFPAYMDQVDFPYFMRFTEKKEPPVKPLRKFIEDLPKEKPKPNSIPVENEGVWFSVIPKFTLDEFNDEIVESLKLYLVNKSPAGYKFLYTQQAAGDTLFELNSEVPSYKDFYLHDISFESLNDNPLFSFEFSLMKRAKRKADYYETSLKLKGRQVFKQIEELKEKNVPAITYRLFDTYPDKVHEDHFDMSSLAAKGYKVYDASKGWGSKPIVRTVIDLHIEKLVNDWSHLSSHEILAIQLKEFEKWYQAAVENSQPVFTVVHGIGSGKLKEEIHELLKTKKEVKTFVNQYHPNFGYGATEILLQY